IMPGRPPATEITTAMQNEAYRPTFGSTPAMIENAIASGISASATTSPESRSPRALDSHSWRNLDIDMFCFQCANRGSNAYEARRAWLEVNGGPGDAESLQGKTWN